MSDDLAARLRRAAATATDARGRLMEEAAERLALLEEVAAAAVGVPEKTEDGVVDFHALRMTYITRIVMAGTDPATARVLARHSDVRLTLKTYSHVGAGAKRRAVEGGGGVDNASRDDVQ